MESRGAAGAVAAGAAELGRERALRGLRAGVAGEPVRMAQCKIEQVLELPHRHTRRRTRLAELRVELLGSSEVALGVQELVH